MLHLFYAIRSFLWLFSCFQTFDSIISFTWLTTNENKIKQRSQHSFPSLFRAMNLLFCLFLSVNEGNKHNEHLEKNFKTENYAYDSFQFLYNFSFLSDLNFFPKKLFMFKKINVQRFGWRFFIEMNSKSKTDQHRQSPKSTSSIESDTKWKGCENICIAMMFADDCILTGYHSRF